MGYSFNGNRVLEAVILRYFRSRNRDGDGEMGRVEIAPSNDRGQGEAAALPVDTTTFHSCDSVSLKYFPFDYVKYLIAS